MNKNIPATKAVVFLLILLVLSSCGVRAVEPVTAYISANPSVAENTPPPTEAPSGSPKAAAISESPAFVRMGTKVQSDSLEMSVITVQKPFRVYPNSEAFFTPGKEYMFLDIGVKVSKLADSEVSAKWNDIYVTNKYEEKWYPIWGVYKDTNVFEDPLTIKVSEYELDPEATDVVFGDNGFLRVIFRVPKGETFYFSLANMPLTRVEFKQVY
jgi:hypothetical protein